VLNGARVLLTSNVMAHLGLVNGTVRKVVGFLHPLEMMALVQWAVQEGHRRLRGARRVDTSRHRGGGSGGGSGRGVPARVLTYRRRGGFSEDNTEAPVWCVETSQGIVFRDLWWSTVKKCMYIPPSSTSFASSSLINNGNDQPQRSRSDFPWMEADRIPYDAVFPTSFAVDVSNITQAPSTPCTSPGQGRRTTHAAPHPENRNRWDTPLSPHRHRSDSEEPPHPS
jgi:hypothetical protein